MKAATEAQAYVLPNMIFQSTPPVKAATLCPPKNRQCASISIHAAREGGDVSTIDFKPCNAFISIHAAREGGDGVAVEAEGFSDDISIHAAREGGDGL